MIQFRSIRLKILLGAGLSIFLITLALTGYAATTLKNKSLASAEDVLINQANNEASAIDAEIDNALNTSRALAQAISSNLTDGNTLTREQVIGMLNQVMIENPTFFGISTEWEPNAFDGLDEEYAGKVNVAEDGHFSPYFYREGEEVLMTFLPRLAADDPAYAYYMVPKTTMQEAVLDPYIYPVNGVDILMTSLMIPIIHDGKFYGTLGVDFTLDFLQQKADKFLENNPDAVYTIFSNTGMIGAMTNHPELIGKPIADVHEDWEQDLSVIQSGQETLEEDDENILVFSPMYFGKDPLPWSLSLTIPIEKVIQNATESMWLMIGIGVILFVLAMLILTWISTKIAQPIKQITQSAESIARGNLRDEITIQSVDEIGTLAQSFRTMQTYLTGIADAARALAANDLRIAVKPVSNEDELGNAFALMIQSLRASISSVSASSTHLQQSSGQLALTSNQAREATSQIASTIQQIASGTVQQADSVSKAGNSVSQLTHAIQDVAHGAQQQANEAA